MSESLQKLAMSCTFVVRSGTLEPTDGGGESPVLCSFVAGAVVDSKYQILAPLGRGGMGAVFRVHHQLLQKDMALKTFLSRSISADAWHRFQREARAIARLKHPNIVEVFDFGIADGSLPYYTMELLEGESLADCLARSGGMDPAQALKLFREAAEALAYAHRQQIVHRDIKPANMYLHDGGKGRQANAHIKIVDFGIAKLAEDRGEENQALTRSGLIFGSPLYMSPEQSLAEFVDYRSDIYSFGCTLFEALTGSPPFVGESALQTLTMHQTMATPVLSEVMGAGEYPTNAEAANDAFKAEREKEAKDPTPYYQGVVNGYKLYRFPKYSLIGRIENGGEKVIAYCQGEQKLEPNRNPIFTATQQCYLSPALLKRFAPDGLFGLHLPAEVFSGMHWTDGHLKYVTGIKSLRSLDLQDNDGITNAALRDIEQFPELINLNVGNTQIDADGLIGFKLLPQLRRLQVTKCGPMTKLFRFMAEKPTKFKVQTLIAGDCSVEDSDLEYLSKIKSLTELRLSKNKIQGSGLAYLAQLPYLEILKLKGNRLQNGSAFELLNKLEHLRELEVSGGIFSDRQLKKFQTRHPNCKIEVSKRD